ncbi:MAG TPA: hypothetical protein VLI92_04520 [Candidatus Saccharimonadales bacterium]|nr:hypothetical protein [Candidatus Saccharimonadales bacterium]
MNIIGHTYIASKVIGRLNSDVAFGSHVNDLVPFVPNSTFSFQEIHESPELFLEFLKVHYPARKDLAWAMMTHSVKFGADKFNRDIDTWLTSGNEQLIEEIANKIVDCSSVSFKVAKEYRMHNYLWCGIDLYLLKKEPDFIKQLPELHKNLDKSGVAIMLAECFGKDSNLVLNDINYLFDEIDFNNLLSIEGLAVLWKRFMAGLPEKDEIDVEKTISTWNYIYNSFDNRWEDILENVVTQVKVQIDPFLTP